MRRAGSFGRTVGIMRIVIAGGHGQIALRLERVLAARGDEVAGIIRKAEQGDDLRAAGAGPGSGTGRKDTVDRGAAVLFADAAVRARVRRFVVVSSMGADPAHQGDDVFDVYLRAKGEADAYVTRQETLDWTILRPGALTDEPGTGLVRLEAHTGRGPVPRDDVAAVLAELVDTSATAGLTLELIGGSTPVPVAVKSVAGN